MDEAPQAVLQERHIEVEQQAGAEAAQAQIAKDLGLVDRRQGLDRLDLHQQRVAHDDIRTKAGSQVGPLIGNRDRHLPLMLYAVGGELLTKTGLIDALEQSGAEVTVNFDCKPDDRLREGVPFSSWAPG